jgi:hypothetical protein
MNGKRPRLTGGNGELSADFADQEDYSFLT